MSSMEGNHMQTIRPLLMLLGVAIITVAAQDSEAKRLGAGSSASAGAAAAKAESRSSSGSGAALRHSAEEEAQRAELKRQALAREFSCVIRPTMSDDEISHCKWAWAAPRP